MDLFQNWKLKKRKESKKLWQLRKNAPIALEAGRVKPVGHGDLSLLQVLRFFRPPTTSLENGLSSGPTSTQKWCQYPLLRKSLKGLQASSSVYACNKYHTASYPFLLIPFFSLSIYLLILHLPRQCLMVPISFDHLGAVVILLSNLKLILPFYQSFRVAIYN